MYGSFRITSQKSLQNVKVDVNKEPVSPRKMFNKINSIMRKIAALISVLFLGETYIMWSTVGVVINKIRFIMPEELGNAIMSMSDPNEVMNVISPYVKYVTLPDLLSFKNFVTGFGVDAPLEGVIYAISIFVIIALIASI